MDGVDYDYFFSPGEHSSVQHAGHVCLPALSQVPRYTNREAYMCGTAFSSKSLLFKCFVCRRAFFNEAAALHHLKVQHSGHLKQPEQGKHWWPGCKPVSGSDFSADARVKPNVHSRYSYKVHAIVNKIKTLQMKNPVMIPVSQRNKGTRQLDWHSARALEGLVIFKTEKKRLPSNNNVVF